MAAATTGDLAVGKVVDARGTGGVGGLIDALWWAVTEVRAGTVVVALREDSALVADTMATLTRRYGTVFVTG